MTDADPQVRVRRRWNDPVSAVASIGRLRELKVRNDPGGVCSPLPRGFLYARVWCDQLAGGDALHACDAGSAPHEIEVCVLDRDNPPAVMLELRRRLRR